MLNAQSTTGVNVVPAQYSIYDGTALPGLRVTGATASMDTANVQFGGASLKLTATATTVTVTLGSSGYPLTLHPNWKWIASVYLKSSRGTINATLTTATPNGSYDGNVSGSFGTGWTRLYADHELTADAATTGTLTLTFTGVTVGDTLNLEAWQLEPVQGDTTLPSPFIITSPPRTWGQVVNDGNKPADGADVTAQNTALDTEHVNGVTSSTVQGNASTAIGQVTQLPVINGGFDIAPVGYGWTADAGSGWTIDTAGNTPGVGPNSAKHAGGAGSGAYRNAGLAACLPGQVYKAQGLIKAVGADGACWVYISWCNAAGGEIGSTVGNQVTGTTTAGSFVVGTAPAGTVYARTCLGVSGHTAGTYYVDNVLCSQYPSSVDEVPDGTSYARSVAGFHSETVDNANFQLPVDASGNVPGWHAFGPAVLSVDPGLPFEGTQSLRISGGAGASVFGAETNRKYVCSPGDVVSVSLQMFSVSGQIGRVQIRFYSPDGTSPGDADVASSGFNAWNAVKLTGTAPAGASYFTILAYNPNNNGGQTNIDRVRVSINDVRVAGSGAILGNQLNAPNSLTLNYGAARTTTALSATSAGVVNVNAFGVNMGGTTVNYNAVSNAVTGLTVGQTYQIYCRDPGGAGGTKTWYAVAGNQNAVLALGYDDAVLGGQVTIPSSGSSGGGGAGCPQVDEPVIRRASDGSGEVIRAGDVRAGDHIWLTRGRWGLVSYSEAKLQPGVRVVGHDGSAITCSASAPLETAEGPCVPADEVQGLVLWHRREGVMRIHDVIDLGDIWVQHITCEDDCFLVGDYSHHNMKP